MPLLAILLPLLPHLIIKGLAIDFLTKPIHLLLLVQSPYVDLPTAIIVTADFQLLV
jgi:hypothetical protein